MYVVKDVNISVLSASELQYLLNEHFEKEGLELISATGNYFIFEERLCIDGAVRLTGLDEMSSEQVNGFLKEWTEAWTNMVKTRRGIKE